MTRTPSSGRHAANVLGALSLVLADRMNTAVEAIAGLGPSAPGALAAMHEFAEGGSVTQLSSILGLTHSGTVRLVDRLAAGGLVERVGAEDGRAVSVVLTEHGRDTAARVLAAREQMLAGVLAELPPDQVDHLATALDALLATVTLARAEERAAPTTGRPSPWLCRLCDFEACGRSEGRCPVNNTATSGSLND